MIQKMKRKGRGSTYAKEKAEAADPQCVGCNVNKAACPICRTSRQLIDGAYPTSATAVAQSVGKYKAQLEIILRDKFPGIISEHKFHPSRRWKFDYALLDERRIAFEYEGIFSNKSRHTGITGYIGDIDKYNEAQLMGWQVYRFTAAHLQDGRAWALIDKI